jgi:hypothetical protein
MSICFAIEAAVKMADRQIRRRPLMSSCKYYATSGRLEMEITFVKIRLDVGIRRTAAAAVRDDRRIKKPGHQTRALFDGIRWYSTPVPERGEAVPPNRRRSADWRQLRQRRSTKDATVGGRK